MPLDIPILSRHKADRNVFIETGSELGRGINTAIEVGFKICRSCDTNPDYVKALNERRHGHDVDVKVEHANSVDFLFKTMPSVRSAGLKPFFWLDAHGDGNTPILEELGAIGQSICAGDVILIDDIRIFRTQEDWARNVGINDVLSAANKIVSDKPLRAMITYESSRWVDDILVITIAEQ